jgi:hypothetical protein
LQTRKNAPPQRKNPTNIAPAVAERSDIGTEFRRGARERFALFRAACNVRPQQSAGHIAFDNKPRSTSGSG